VYSEIEVTREAMGGAGCPFRNESYASFADAMASALRADTDTIRQWQVALGTRHDWSKVTDRVLATMGLG
jgi:hypothetical protein